MKLLVMTLILSCILLAPNVGAQCPVPALDGTWAFNTQGGSLVFHWGSPPGSPVPWPWYLETSVYSSAGQFLAASGRLQTVTTLSQDTNIYRLQNAGGKYTVFDDCSGGTLTFTSGTLNLQFDFWFVHGKSEIYMICSQNQFLLTGVAKRVS